MSTAHQLANLDTQLGDVAQHPIDMVVEVADGGERMYRIGVNQSVVCAQLTVLDDALQSGMRETSGRTVTIGAEFATKENVTQLLTCIYTDAWSKVFNANAVVIYRLAHMYGGGFCAPFQLAALAVERLLTTENFWSIVHAAGQIGDRRLIAKCESFAKQAANAKSIVADESWTSLVVGASNDPVVRMTALITKHAAQQHIYSPLHEEWFWTAVRAQDDHVAANGGTPSEYWELVEEAKKFLHVSDMTRGKTLVDVVRGLPNRAVAFMLVDMVRHMQKELAGKKEST